MFEMTLILLVGLNSPQVEKPFKPTAVFRGTHSLIQKPRIELVEDATTWAKIWKEHRGTDRSFTETDQDFDVDFDTSRVICVFCGRSGIAPMNCGAVEIDGAIHVRYSLGANDYQFRPEPFGSEPEPAPAHDSKKEDIRGYMFVLVPKGKTPVVVESKLLSGRSFKWIVHARFPDPNPKKQ